MTCKYWRIAQSEPVILSSVRLVFVHDPTDAQGIPVGKQALNPSHIFYRPCSGIWQQVWIESTPADHITQLDVAAEANGESMPKRPQLLYATLT